jgi:hypothetical protein
MFRMSPYSLIRGLSPSSEPTPFADRQKSGVAYFYASLYGIVSSQSFKIPIMQYMPSVWAVFRFMLADISQLCCAAPITRETQLRAKPVKGNECCLNLATIVRWWEIYLMCVCSDLHRWRVTASTNLIEGHNCTWPNPTRNGTRVSLASSVGIVTC